VILAVVLPLSHGDPARAVTVASLMAVVSGLVCILIGVLRLGFVTELLSKPIRYGYMNGIALTVLISQLPKLFGFSIDGTGPLRDLVRITEAVLGGKANWIAFAVGAGTLVAILLLKPFKRIPGLLIAVVGATIVVGALGLEQTAGVKVLGSLPHVWSNPRYRPGGSPRSHRIPLGRLAAASCRPRPRRRYPRLPRPQALSRSASRTRPGAVPLGCAALLRQR
jgi:MFS superfamily sulfate permease-like transporter